MATNVMMEALSPTMEEGRLVKWLKNVGDPVKSGETIAEVETDKAIMELVARGAGVLRARMIDEGATSPVGEVIAIIAAADEVLSGAAEQPTAGGAVPSAPSAPTASPRDSLVAVPSASPRATSAPPRSSPLARRLASERGIALEQLSGSGPNGRIIRRDIESIATSPAVTAAPAAPAARVTAAAPVAPSIVFDGDIKDVPLTQIRKTIARRLSESIGPIPTFYLTSEIDMTQVGTLRAQMLANGDQFKVSVNDIVLKAVAVALSRHPECNAHWLNDHIRYFARVHLGMAVATDDGLIVPVITDAQSKGLGQIGREARDFAKRARERKLQPAEYTGSTFSVSNLGMFGIDQFTAIINPPEAAILAIGATETKPVWVDAGSGSSAFPAPPREASEAPRGMFVPRQRMRVTLSCDHRVIDGAVGARFLQTLRQLLEAPMMMLF